MSVLSSDVGGGLRRDGVRAANGLSRRWAAALGDGADGGKGTAYSEIGRAHV